MIELSSRVHRIPVLVTVLVLFLSLAGPSATFALDEIVVDVPASTPADESVYLTGSIPELGSWAAMGKKLQKTDKFRWKCSLRLPRHQDVHCKFTRGHFDRVEKALDGSEIPNRTLRVTSSTDQKYHWRVHSWADQVVPPLTDPANLNISGEFVLFPSVPSQFLRHKRDVIVLLPPGYRDPKNQSRRYGVLYMHDGQNLFDPRTSFLGKDWQVDEVSRRLIKSGHMEPIIIVGIANTPDRNTEYTPFVDPKHQGGGGEWYGRFLTEELKPFVDERFRTLPGRDHTGIGGSSLGGLISIFLGLKHSKVFSRIMVISPSAWWADGEIIRRVAKLVKDEGFVKIWMDMGQDEGAEGLHFTRELAKELRRLFPNRSQFRYEEFPGANHSEEAWSKRIHLPLTYLFGRARP